SGPPDDRGVQIDGTGWVLWAADHILGSVPAGDPRAGRIRTDLDPLLTRSTLQLLDQVDTTDSLPAPSADYWEHRERDLTLGTAAPVLAGLDAAHRIWSGTAQPDLAERAGAAAGELRRAIESDFGPEYGRYAGTAERD